jgi:hypothetical protein
MQTRNTKASTRPPKSGKATMKPDDEEQSRAFIEKAREIEADEKHSAADKLMERLAKTKPEPHTKKG